MLSLCTGGWCPGLVIDARLEDNARIVTFASGAVGRDLLADVDDVDRRFCPGRR